VRQSVQDPYPPSHPYSTSPGGPDMACLDAVRCPM
jgi:hypothetical protein